MAELEIFDCEQNSPEWYQVRCGIVTASTFADVLAKGRGGEDSKTRKKLLYTLVGEVMSGEPISTWGGNAHTERGHAMEADARRMYAMMTDSAPRTVGFMRRGRIGASPDSCVGDDGLVEIKSKLPHLHLEALEADRLPPEHVAQVQGQLLVSGRQWCDFVSYWPGLPIFIKRVYPDIEYQGNLQHQLNVFIEELDFLINKYRNY